MENYRVRVPDSAEWLYLSFVACVGGLEITIRFTGPTSESGDLVSSSAGMTNCSF